MVLCEENDFYDMVPAADGVDDNGASDVVVSLLSDFNGLLYRSRGVWRQRPLQIIAFSE